jgi:hypothetical protein
MPFSGCSLPSMVILNDVTFINVLGIATFHVLFSIDGVSRLLRVTIDWTEPGRIRDCKGIFLNEELEEVPSSMSRLLKNFSPSDRFDSGNFLRLCRNGRIKEYRATQRSFTVSDVKICFVQHVLVLVSV